MSGPSPMARRSPPTPSPKPSTKCAAAGGGIVQFPNVGKRGPIESATTVPSTAPACVYLTGPITLKSNITLQIDEGVTVKFSSDRSLYPLVKTRYESVDIMNFSPLIYAYQCDNIKITGKGTLDGQAQRWWTWARGNPSTNIMRQYVNDRDGKFPLEQRVFGETHPGYRTCFIEPYECKHVVIEGVTLRQSPFWNIHPLYSEDVIVRDVTVFGDGPNTDGCDPDSSKRVLIEKCNFTTGDDCIAIKSGRDGDGIRKNATCENITIRDCIMKGGHGAVTMGSETSAGIKHVFAENCKVDGPDSAIRLKSTRGRGGGIEDVFIKNMQVTSTKQYGITIDMLYTRTPEAAKSETTPVFKNIRIEDFHLQLRLPQGIYIMGLNESNVENVILKNITIKGDKAHENRVPNTSPASPAKTSPSPQKPANPGTSKTPKTSSNPYKAYALAGYTPTGHSRLAWTPQQSRTASPSRPDRCMCLVANGSTDVTPCRHVTIDHDMEDSSHRHCHHPRRSHLGFGGIIAISEGYHIWMDTIAIAPFLHRNPCYHSGGHLSLHSIAPQNNRSPHAPNPLRQMPINWRELQCISPKPHAEQPGHPRRHLPARHPPKELRKSLLRTRN